MYGASVKTFAEREFDMFPPVSDEEIERYRSQRVVPTPFAGKPDLIAAWEKGDLQFEPLPRGQFKVWATESRELAVGEEGLTSNC